MTDKFPLLPTDPTELARLQEDNLKLRAEEAQHCIKLVCSFCGKSHREVRKLIAGPCGAICNECVEVCMDILRNPKGKLRVEEDRNRVVAAGDDEQRLGKAVDLAHSRLGGLFNICNGVKPQEFLLVVRVAYDLNVAVAEFEKAKRLRGDKRYDPDDDPEDGAWEPRGRPRVLT